MAKKKLDGVKQEYYDPFARGGKRGYPAQSQEQIEWMLERTLLELAMNRFEWKNLPKEVDVRWLEMIVNTTGLSVFFREKNDGMFRAMQGTPFGPVNLIGQNIRYRVQGGMGWSRELSIKECVPIWCNYTRIPDMDKIRIYAHRVALLDRTIEINSLNARRSKYLRANERTRLSVENMNRMIEEGSPFLPVADEADPNTLMDTIDLGVDPATIVNLHMLRTRVWQEGLNHLGINTGNQDKKERLVAAESAANDDAVETVRKMNLNARKFACAQINEMFKLDVDVEYATDDTTAAKQADEVDKAPALKAVNQ